MKWLKRKVIQWVREDWEEERKKNEECMPSTISLREDRRMDADPTLNFRVFSAIGGQVVEFRRYDHKTDRSDTTTYIIDKDDDFGEKISKIANLEMLK